MPVLGVAAKSPVQSPRGGSPRARRLPTSKKSSFQSYPVELPYEKVGRNASRNLRRVGPQVRQRIQRAFRLTDAASALIKATTRHARDKIVLKVPEEARYFRASADHLSSRVMKIFLSCVGLMIATFNPIAAAPAPPDLMKAIVVHQFGGPEVLKYEEAPRPDPKEDEILIRTIAAGVNPVDAYIRSGRFGGHNLPYIPGMEVAGIVEKAGAKISKFKAGDQVYAHLGFKDGGYAQFSVA